MTITKSESTPQFNNDDLELIEPMPIYATKVRLRSILEENGAENLSDLAKLNTTREPLNPKDSARAKFVPSLMAKPQLKS
ncbi:MULTISPECIES: hypothetical protein [Pseudomonas]|jgi:hypothetical protein|uniref:hypothetical protein n=1 Tax=Pseudomonas TaxID=286 RepID=UPI00117AC688|nr:MULTISPECIES: hypothetical protein [Pseudomonas]MDD2029388.1 hypothetical protein [Pseudomonas putida]MDF3928954.1 hypothetical protein [Pseudomonas putida]MDH1696887.1 hypothetical protein [Pseudomonas sp. GD03766]QUG87552.1 hypothetical protein GR140_01840 [Pseudomonas putida]HDS1769821.1 hypothetical protein [Pseudomonas putida]